MTRTAAALIAAAGTLTIAAAPASAAPSCALEANELQIEMNASGDFGAVSLFDSGAIEVGGAARGETPAEIDCNVPVSMSNVDQISVRDVTANGSARFRLDGAEEFESAAIPVEIELGAGTSDVFEVTGTDADDELLVGVDAIAFDLDDNSLDNSGVTHSGADGFVVRGLGGDDGLYGNADSADIPSPTQPIRFVTGASDAGEVVFGGAGPDTIVGGAGDDSLHGSRGSDVIRGRGGNDGLSGFTGRDALFGGGGRDALSGRDGTRDKRIACGPGRDEANRDRRLDPRPSGCEARLAVAPPL